MHEEFDAIYEETYQIIFRYVLSKADNVANVEDIMQNIYTNFYATISRKSDYVRDNKKFLITLAKRELFKYYKSKEKFKELFSNVDFDIIENVNLSSSLESDDFINSLNRGIVWEEIKKEDIVTQKILVLHYLDGLSSKSIADLLDLNENTVKTKIHRTVKKIRERVN